MNTFVDTMDDSDVMVAQPSVDEVLARWKARADAYQYDPSKTIKHYPLEQFMQELRQAVREQQ